MSDNHNTLSSLICKIGIHCRIHLPQVKVYTSSDIEESGK